MNEYFEYLDELRASGKTNMFGARTYLASRFALDKKESAEVLSLWMKTYGDDPVADRVAKAKA